MNVGAAPSATASATDAELVDAVRAGEESAFGELFRRYRPRVHAFVQRRVRDEGRAEELTQEAFLSALRRLRETESELSFRPWIYEIARNSTIDHFRRSSRAHEVPVDAVERLGPSEHLRLVGDRGPHREVAAKQDLETLRGAFDELSERHERIIVLRELEGLSYREIGERMQLSRPGVESTLFRARRRLETEFAELDTGRRCVAVRGAMGRLAEGMDMRGDRGLVRRHARRCGACRATAHELGADPTLARGPRRRAAPAAGPARRLRRQGGAAVVAVAALAGGGAGARGSAEPSTRAMTAGPPRPGQSSASSPAPATQGVPPRAPRGLQPRRAPHAARRGCRRERSVRRAAAAAADRRRPRPRCPRPPAHRAGAAPPAAGSPSGGRPRAGCRPRTLRSSPGNHAAHPGRPRRRDAAGRAPHASSPAGSTAAARSGARSAAGALIHAQRADSLRRDHGRDP